MAGPGGGGRDANGNGTNGASPGGPRRPRLPHSDARKRRRERVARSRRTRRVAVLVALAAIVALVASIAVGSVVTVSAFRESCSLDSLDARDPGENSEIFAANGRRLGYIRAESNRLEVPLTQVSPWLLKATVAIEDRRFYEHDGIDFEGIARAAVKNVQAGDIQEGGSTITQQLVRNLYIGREQSLERKVKEACLALKVEKQWSKDEILSRYVNLVFYGNAAYGIEAAAQTYFSKRARNLTLPEAALLAGLPQAPSVFDPFGRERVATERYLEVLKAMRASGSITADQYEDALSERVELKPGRVFTEVKESLFVQFVTDTLIREYGVSFVRSGGLKIYTTIDPRLQDFAEQAIHGRLNVTGDPAATLVAIDPRTGAIRAMVQAQTGVRERSIQFNYATRGLRQSGSAFKTFVLTEAVRRGIDPYTTLYRSAPFVYQPVPDIEPWAPRTFDNRYAGDVTIANATVRSDNAVYARLTLDLGPESIVKIARRMGVTTSPLRPVPSIGLGSNDVTVLEMASAYATLSAGGVYIQPRAIRKIVRDGAVYDQDTWTKPKRKRVFLDGVAETVTRILESNVQGGTGTSANLGNGWRAAGKTGTTDEFTDAWFCGYTPVLATAVWVGYPQGKIEMTNVHGRAVSGGSFPAEIWHDFMQRALSGIRIRDFAPARKFPAEISWKGQYQQVGDLPETSTDETETAETETAGGPPGAPGEQAPEQPAAPPAEPAPPQPAAPPPPEQPAPPPEQPAPPPAEPVPPAPAPPPAPPPPAEPAPPQPAPPSPGEPPPTTT